MTGRVAELNSRLGNLISAPGAVSSKNGAAESFQKVMDQTGSRSDASETEQNLRADVAQKAPAGKSADTGRIKDVSVKNEAPEEMQDIEDEVEKAASAAVMAVAEILNVPVEDVQAAMEQLDLTPTDLLNTDNLAPLVAELKGDGDVSMFLMDSVAYGELKEVIGAVEELDAGILEKFPMTQEEFGDVLQNISEAEDGVLQPAAEQPVVKTQEESGPVVVVKDMTNERQTADTTVNTEAQDGQKTEEVIPEAQDAQKGAPGEEKHTEEQEKSFQGNANAQPFEQIYNPVRNQVPVEESYHHSAHVDTDDIMRQITEQIKLSLKPESTIMEMELNPASLGRVSVHLEAKNGMITAQFAAQNAAVKEAIESQAVQLRETLEAQGVKVDAVEVTIASHEFERNLQQESGNRGEEKEKKAGAVSRKKINLNLMEEEGEEELSEEEALAKDIMIQNGNSVDYTA